MENAHQNRRRFPRIKIPPAFRVKAKIRLMGEKETHYFQVDNLSMGGANLLSKKGVDFVAKPGDTLEIMIYGGGLSLRCVARFVQETRLKELCSQMGIEIIGIDDKSRGILSSFLQQLDQNAVRKSA